MLAVLLWFLPVLAAAWPAQGALRDYEKLRLEVRLECGQRHLDYGLLLRRRGLTTPATEQFFLAVETSEDMHWSAEVVLKALRDQEDDFWKRTLKRPSPAQLGGYARQAAELRRADRSARLRLVRWCERAGLENQAAAELTQLFLELDEPLHFEADGDLVLDIGRITGRLAQVARESAVEINGQLYPRDRFLTRLGHVPKLHECSSEALRVRTTTSPEDARELHALASALLPRLEALHGAQPSRRLQIVVLERRRDYEAYLDAVGLQVHRTADGFADPRCSTAVLTAEGSDREHVLGLVLHELTHLFQLSLSPAVFPSWYLEGSAEAFGGEGTFVWDGTTLTTDRPMAVERLRAMRERRQPLTTLLEGEALRLLGRDRETARRFYAQSWAFVRFLRTGLGGRHARLFERWLDRCLGSAIGADLDRPYAVNSSESLDLFFELFEPELATLDAAFGAWLDALIAESEAR